MVFTTDISTQTSATNSGSSTPIRFCGSQAEMSHKTWFHCKPSGTASRRVLGFAPLRRATSVNQKFDSELGPRLGLDGSARRGVHATRKLCVQARALKLPSYRRVPRRQSWMAVHGMVCMLLPCIRTRAPSFITVCLSELNENAWHGVHATHKPYVRVGTPVFITVRLSVLDGSAWHGVHYSNCVFGPGPLKLLPWQGEAFLASCPVEKWAQRRREGKGWFHSPVGSLCPFSARNWFQESCHNRTGAAKLSQHSRRG